MLTNEQILENLEQERKYCDRKWMFREAKIYSIKIEKLKKRISKEMVIKDGKMVGNTAIKENQTIVHGSKSGLDVICRECAKPFIESLQENGSLLNGSILCARCEKELAYVVEV